MGAKARNEFVESVRVDEANLNNCICINSKDLENLDRESEKIFAGFSLINETTEEVLRECVEKMKRENMDHYEIFPENEVYDVDLLTPLQEGKIANLFIKYNTNQIAIRLKDYVIRLNGYFKPTKEGEKKYRVCFNVTFDQINQVLEHQIEQ